MKGRAHTQGLHALMDRYGDDDPRAFTRLHAALSSRLRGFLMKMVQDPAAVDDLLQLTFLKAHLARDRFEPRGDDPDAAVQGWYFAIARNVALDYLRHTGRKARRQVELRGYEESPDLDLADGGGSIEDAIVDQDQADEIIARVRDAIAQLPERQREVVELHKLRGMSMAEVGERLEIREGTARVRAHRGYKTLARILGAGGASSWLLATIMRAWEIL